jgi:hypothetical protein
LAVTPFCITFAVFWAVYRDKSSAWIGQGILVRINCFYIYVNFSKRERVIVALCILNYDMCPGSIFLECLFLNISFDNCTFNNNIE